MLYGKQRCDHSISMPLNLNTQPLRQGVFRPLVITVVAQPLQGATRNFTEAPGDGWAGTIGSNHTFTGQELKVCLLYHDERAKWAASSILVHVAMADVKVQNRPLVLYVTAPQRQEPVSLFMS